jgi:hypothetical protein
MISGKPAERPARIKRLIPNATRTNIVNSTPVCPVNTSQATTSRFIERARLENKRARCLETRSKIVPTNGPTNEYGKSTTANAMAALSASACRSGENKTKEASAL